MRKQEIEMTNKFFEYALETISKNGTQNLKAQKVVSELLKHEGITKPSNLWISETSISDLKYKGANIKSCGIALYKHIITIGY